MPNTLLCLSFDGPEYIYSWEWSPVNIVLIQDYGMLGFPFEFKVTSVISMFGYFVQNLLAKQVLVNATTNFD